MPLGGVLVFIVSLICDQVDSCEEASSLACSSIISALTQHRDYYLSLSVDDGWFSGASAVEADIFAVMSQTSQSKIYSTGAKQYVERYIFVFLINSRRGRREMDIFVDRGAAAGGSSR